MSEIETDMDKLEEARRAESARTAQIPVATGKTQPKHREPGDAFIVKLVGNDWLGKRMAEIGLKPGMQVKGVLTDSPEGDEFHVIGYEMPLKEGDPVVAGQVYAYDSEVENWCCEVIERIKESPFGDSLDIEPDGADEVEGQDDPDMVNSPPHYQGNGMEVIDVIEAFNIDRKSGHLQNVVKYALRAGDKGDLQTDVDKLVWYAQRLQARVRANGGTW